MIMAYWVLNKVRQRVMRFDSEKEAYDWGNDRYGSGDWVGGFDTSLVKPIAARKASDLMGEYVYTHHRGELLTCRSIDGLWDAYRHSGVYADESME